METIPLSYIRKFIKRKRSLRRRSIVCKMLLLIIAFLALISTGIADLSSEYAHHAVLDPAKLMKLHWTVDWERQTVSFAVEAATTGWVGFGFSSGNGMMVGSDVVIGWVKDSKGYITVRMKLYFYFCVIVVAVELTFDALRVCFRNAKISLCSGAATGGLLRQQQQQ